MTPRKPQVCREPGCPNIEPCAAHPRAASRSPSSRETGRAAYRRARAKYQRDRPPCHWCGRPATTPDHLQPVSRGGTSAPHNLVPACARCNYSRGNRPTPS